MAILTLFAKDELAFVPDRDTEQMSVGVVLFPFAVLSSFVPLAFLGDGIIPRVPNGLAVIEGFVGCKFGFGVQLAKNKSLLLSGGLAVGFLVFDNLCFVRSFLKHGNCRSPDYRHEGKTEREQIHAEQQERCGDSRGPHVHSLPDLFCVTGDGLEGESGGKFLPDFVNDLFDNFRRDSIGL